MWNGNTIMVSAGQVITGRKELSHATGIPQTTIERVLNFLENEHQIGQQKTTKYRLITILNWKQHQKSDSTSDNKRTTDGQQADTNKKLKKDKNEKKDIAPIGAEVFSLKEEIKKLEDSPRRDLNIIAFYFSERRPRFENIGQFQTALRRHLRPAKELVPFTDAQIAKASMLAKEKYPEWTLETLTKIVTK